MLWSEPTLLDRCVGIFCVNRKNITGGVHEFEKKDGHVVQHIVHESHLLVNRDPNVVKSRFIPISLVDPLHKGYYDILTMSKLTKPCSQ